MAGRKITLNEAAELKAAVYEYVQLNPGIYRYQLMEAFKSAPADTLARLLRGLIAEGKVQQKDLERGSGPQSRLYPTVDLRVHEAQGLQASING